MSDTPHAPTGPSYAVVMPVKPPSRGKSRLVGLADGAREELAAAFALDTVTACLAARHVGA
ncbi:MAG: 2-phospho-L-lactate guanylyltransferase, partial [Actinobacteria bacterium]|nr:2-phospho-L-lactate guanylyltransferase [Actinomycetota bacterium]